MLGELVPVVLVPAAALALAIRVPGQVSHGKAPMGPQVQQALVALGLLVGASWLALLAGPALAATDLGGFAVALIALPLTVAVAYVLQPQQLDPAPAAAAKGPAAEKASEPKSAKPAAKAKTEPEPKPEAAPAKSEPRAQSQIETLVSHVPIAPAPRTLKQPEIDGTAASEAAAMARIIDRLGERPGVVFSPYAEGETNEALHRIAAHLRARRYMSLPPEEDATDAEHNEAARQAAGPNAGHGSELALDLAGGAITSVLLVDDRIELSALAVQGLERVDSTVLCGTSETELVSACKVRLPLEAEGPQRAEFLNKLADKLGAGSTKEADKVDAERSGATQAGLFAPPPSSFAPPVVPPPAASSAPLVPPPSSSTAPLAAPPVVSSPAGARKSTGLTGLFAAVGTPAPSAPAPMPLTSVPQPSAPKVNADDEDASKSDEEE